MRFYKVEGVVAEVADENGESVSRAYGDVLHCAAVRGERFNQDLNGQAYFFISAASEGTLQVRLGILAEDSSDISGLLKAYLAASGLALSDFTVDEITLQTMRRMLSVADRNNYIEDDDDVLY